MKRISVFLVIIFLSASAYSERVIPEGQEGYLKSVIRPFDREFKGYKLENIEIDQKRVTYRYCVQRDCFGLILDSETSSGNPLAKSKNFYIYLDKEDASFGRELVDAVVNNDTGEIYINTSAGVPFFSLDINKIYILLMVIIALIALSYNNRVIGLFDKLYLGISNMPDFIYWSFFSLIIIGAVQVRFKGIYLPLVEEGSALRLLYSYDSAIYNLFVSNDPRHPGLYFTILKPFLLLSSDPAHIARIISATLSVLSVGVIGLIFKNLNRILSLFSMALLSLHPEYIHRSREITDISLFVLMSLLSIWFLQKSLKEGQRKYYILFTIFSILSCYSSYAAYVNLAGMILYLSISRRIREFFPYILSILIFVLPYLWKIISSFGGEFHLKSMSGMFPNIIWGGEGILSFLTSSFSSLFAGEYTIIILSLIMVYLLLSIGNLSRDSLFFSLFVSNLAFLLLFRYFRMMPYYALFLPVSFILLISQESRSQSERFFEKSFRLLVMVFTLFAFYENLQERYEPIYIQSYHLRTNPQIPVRVVRESGVKDIVIDIEHNKYILGYYFFDNPFESLIRQGCSIQPDQTLICYEGKTGRRITVLTSTFSIKRGWEERSVERLKSIGYDDYFFVYDRNYSNEKLLKYLSESCIAVLLGEKNYLYRCPGETPSSPVR